ncbi:MAG TPA: hypothetical protein VHE37_00160 [Nevskiaceae bacterium]|nr:hypothetical protein [Nevskiaceae bacterium]
MKRSWLVAVLFAAALGGGCSGGIPGASGGAPGKSTQADSSLPGSYHDPASRCVSPQPSKQTSIAVAKWTLSDQAVTSDHVSPYMAASFVQATAPYTFNQAPSWANDGRVLGGMDGDKTQIYNAQLDGSDAHCLTCSHPGDTADGKPAKNGLPQMRPQGDWIMFESTRGHSVVYSGDGLGGAGDAIWVMRPDGSCPVQLTGVGSDGEIADDFHAYWSPDGKHINWTHLSGNVAVDNYDTDTEFTMRVADFIDDGTNPPRVDNIINVGERGEAYETELWAPDGSGFLFQYGDQGDNQEIYFIRLYGNGATPTAPLVQHLSDGTPGWDEQALFTPDMSAVIYMSSKDCSTCSYNIQTALEQFLHVPPLPDRFDGLAYVGLFFEAVLPAFVLPPQDGGFSTDLYLLDLHTKSLRRLTNDNGVIPEFYFDAQGRKLIWSENHVYGGAPKNNTQTAYFEGLP